MTAHQIRTWREQTRAVLGAFTPELDEQIATVAAKIRAALAQGRQVYAFGNGGSASDAQHFTAELVGRFSRNRPAIAATALTVNTSDLTAIGNDFGYDQIFARQVEAFVRPGDVVIAISTSGNSPNVLKAVEVASKRNAIVVGLTGAKGGALAEQAHIALKVPSNETPRIQESHIFILHSIAALVEGEAEVR